VESTLSESVRAVERAIDVLLCFDHEERGLTLTQIAGRVRMSKSTVHRLLATLENKHFVNRDKASGLYHLGLGFIEVASLVLQEMDLERWALPYLQRLSAECGETVDLAILDDAHVVYLLVVESVQRVKIAAAVGERLPACCTATGKAFLAYLPAEQVHAILDKSPGQYRDGTPVSLPNLCRDLQATRERGYAISEQEYEQDINAVAAPILNADGWPMLVIAIVGPSFRLSPERMQLLGQSIRTTVDAITREIGPSALSSLISRTIPLSREAIA
jgi:IclR family transcriptional regulator, KDG regulon repressor